MSHRFRFIGQRVSDSEWNLREDELHHIKKVLRLEDGAEIEVTDGQGQWCVGFFQSQSKTVRVKEAHIQGESAQRAICVGVLKHHWFEEALPSLVETGVTAVHVFAQTHTDKFIFADKFHMRALKLIENAAKQCKQARFPTATIHKDLQTLLAHFKTDSQGVYFNMGEETSLSDFKFQKQNRFAVIGSEGGLSDEEISMLRAAKLSPLKMGGLTLRAFTASIIASAFLENA